MHVYGGQSQKSPESGRGEWDQLFDSVVQMVSHPEPKSWGAGGTESATSNPLEPPGSWLPELRAQSWAAGGPEGHGERARGHGPEAAGAGLQPSENLLRTPLSRRVRSVREQMQAGNEISCHPCVTELVPFSPTACFYLLAT